MVAEGTSAAGSAASPPSDAPPFSSALPWWAQPFRALRHRNYRLYFLGQLVSVTGSWVQTTALMWLAFETTGQATTLRAGSVQPPAMDAIPLGFERDLIKSIAVGLTWNAKWTYNLFEFDDANLIWNGSGSEPVGNRIGVIDNRFRLRAEHVTDSKDVLILQHQLRLLKWRILLGNPLINRWRRHPDPVGLGLEQGNVTHFR